VQTTMPSPTILESPSFNPTDDKDNIVNVIHVAQGEFRISKRNDDLISTVLGSCVATCMWDPVRKIGGVNHFLLAEGETEGIVHSRYGVHSMELLINGLLKLGAERNRLEAKLFGGARMYGAFGSVGEDNARFARQFLIAEKIPCRAESLGGKQARKLRFWPTTGRAQQMLLSDENAVVPTLIHKKPTEPLPDTDITFF
jgi:chemotaxis protein CheD